MAPGTAPVVVTRADIGQVDVAEAVDGLGQAGEARAAVDEVGRPRCRRCTGPISRSSTLVPPEVTPLTLPPSATLQPAWLARGRTGEDRGSRGAALADRRDVDRLVAALSSAARSHKRRVATPVPAVGPKVALGAPRMMSPVPSPKMLFPPATE